MNPPFTRATGRGGREHGGLFGFLVDEKVRTSVLYDYNKAREKVDKDLLLISQKYLEDFKDGTFKGIRHAGEGLVFIYLAYLRLNDGGRIAFVLPKSVLSGASWFLIRTLFLEKFHVEYVVVSYDKENGYNFSQSTNYSEVLVVARKSKGSSNNQSTKFIMMLMKPKTFFDFEPERLRRLDRSYCSLQIGVTI
jgi:hypothetical protein